MKNMKQSIIPPLIENEQIVNDAQAQSNLFNDLFSWKSTVPNASDPAPPLPVKTNILSGLSKLNTSPIEVAEIIKLKSPVTHFVESLANFWV